VDEVEGLRQALGLGQINLYGHSYGGMVAQGYALKYPGSLKRLILANTLHSAEMWQKGNNDNWNHEVQNQYPELWMRLDSLRGKWMLSTDSTFVVISTISQHEKDQKPACVNCGSKNVEQYYSSVTVITSKKS
jgi:pimeloyl-ACP methyl ester carboxylesterase